MIGLKHVIDRDGYGQIIGLFNLADLEEFEGAIIDIARRKCRDFGITTPLPDDPLALLAGLERCSHPDFYQLTHDVGGTTAAAKLLGGTFLNYCVMEVLGAAGRTSFATLPSFFWNDPSAKRIQYDWHQECSYFPGVDNGLHLWFPLFRDVTTNDGPMLIAEGSHLAKLPYRYAKEADSVTQLVPEIDVAATYKIHECNLKRGDGVFFHHNAIHATGENKSGIPRVAGIIRFVDMLGAKKFSRLYDYALTEERAEQTKALAVNA